MEHGRDRRAGAGVRAGGPGAGEAAHAASGEPSAGGDGAVVEPGVPQRARLQQRGHHREAVGRHHPALHAHSELPQGQGARRPVPPRRGQHPPHRLLRRRLRRHRRPIAQQRHLDRHPQQAGERRLGPRGSLQLLRVHGARRGLPLRRATDRRSAVPAGAAPGPLHRALRQPRRHAAGRQRRRGRARAALEGRHGRHGAGGGAERAPGQRVRLQLLSVGPLSPRRLRNLAGPLLVGREGDRSAERSV